jgi:CheY-like chemotaxis protein
MAHCDKKMILIVDDSPDDIELTTIALKATGRDLSVNFVLGGEPALAMIRKSSELPALILLDLKMPGMGGLDVLCEIRADNRLRKIPVVVATSSSLKLDRTNAIAAGANGYIQKSLHLNQFCKDMESVLRRYLPN